MNGININRYQFEYDLTWMSFFQNHRGQTYLRFGGREDSGPESHLSKQALIEAMKTALRLHRSEVELSFDRFNPSGDAVERPEQLPGMQKMLAKRQVKCIHCHDVKTAQLRELGVQGKLTKESVFTYPSPANLGIQLDPVRQTHIRSIGERSAAATAGLKSGDSIETLDGHPVYSFADVTRVLQLAPERGVLPIVVRRAGESVVANVGLGDKWRTLGDPSWRESTHVVGPNSGFWGVKQTAAKKKTLGVGESKLAVKVTAIWGQWARDAGIKHGDIVIEIDGRKNDMHIKQLQTYLQMKKNWGDTVALTVLRGKRQVTLTMNLPAKPSD